MNICRSKTVSRSVIVVSVLTAAFLILPLLAASGSPLSAVDDVLWSKIVDSGGEDRGLAVSDDPSGNPVVCGESNGEIWVRKYRESNGESMWTRTVNSGHGNDQGWGIDCDSSGNPVVVGHVETAGDQRDIWIRKYRGSDGGTLWTRTYDHGQGDDKAWGVSCDLAGNPIVTGWVEENSANVAWARKYSGSDGQVLWTRTYSGSAYSEFYGVSCDPGGNPIVGGITSNTPGVGSALLCKYRGSDGTIVWTREFNIEEADINIAYGGSCDPFGNLAACGSSISGPNINGWTGKYRCSDGSPLWTDTYEGGVGDMFTGTSCDPDGNPSIVGITDNGTNADILVRKYGALEWPVTWYLAEGSTGSNESGNFETWVLIQNPGDVAAEVDIYYQTTSGETQGPHLSLAPGTRETVNVAETVGSVWSVSTRITSDSPVISERAMYWNTPTVRRQAAHDSIGFRP